MTVKMIEKMKGLHYICTVGCGKNGNCSLVQ